MDTGDSIDYRDMLNRFYGSGKEENRLCVGHVHRLEKITVDAYLGKVLKPGMSVLDACAGGGAYCFDLARVGMRVTAGDIVKRHVALLVFTYLCRYGCMMKNLNEHPDQIDRIVGQYESRRKRCSYRMVPEEATHLAQRHGLEQIYHVSCQGASALISPSLEKLSEDDFERYCGMHLASCEEPSLIGVGIHGLFIGRKLS